MLVKYGFLKPLNQSRQGGLKMLRKDFILLKTRNLLNEFMSLIIEKADKPRQKFWRQSRSLVISSSSCKKNNFSNLPRRSLPWAKPNGLVMTSASNEKTELITYHKLSVISSDFSFAKRNLFEIGGCVYSNNSTNLPGDQNHRQQRKRSDVVNVVKAE